MIKATYKEIENVICPNCQEESTFHSEGAGPHTLYRCLNCKDCSLTYEAIQERNPEKRIKAVGRF